MTNSFKSRMDPARSLAFAGVCLFQYPLRILNCHLQLGDPDGNKEVVSCHLLTPIRPVRNSKVLAEDIDLICFRAPMLHHYMEASLHHF